ncbi:hypothetical protein [Halococcus sp. PRR34]|uniref:hypothetical protein n=1 Tax=Halococcus sp. PRR34 TaxID=3020830 RepID=UPI0023600B8A|nr:hypothetical protein [Halococcus sp. PRR34]
MTLTELKEVFQKHLQKVVEDPLHFPQAAHFVPFASILFVFYVISQSIQFAANTRAVINVIPLLGIELGILVFAGVAFVVGSRAYDWRMDFADRQPKLYRLTQIWRLLLGALALAMVGYVYGTSVAMPTAMTGTIPKWVFAVFTLGLAALVSISVTTLAHGLLSIYRVTGRGG